MRTTCKMHVRKTAVSAVADIPPHNRPQRSLRLRHLQISVYPYFRYATRVMGRERRRLESHPLPAGMCAFSRGLLPGAAGAPRRRRNSETLPRTRNPPTAPTLPKNFTARVSRLHAAAAVCAQLPHRVQAVPNKRGETSGAAEKPKNLMPIVFSKIFFIHSTRANDYTASCELGKLRGSELRRCELTRQV
jgi:hypothetical protein